MLNHEDHVKYAERDRRNCEEVHGCDALTLIPQKSLPSLNFIGLRIPSGHGARDDNTETRAQTRAFTDIDPELLELSVDPWCPPPVLECHPPDELSSFGVDSWPTRSPPPRLAGPEPTEALAVPADDGLGLYDHERALPPAPHTTKQDQEEAIGARQVRAPALVLQDGDLLAKRRVLDRKVP